MRPGRGTAQVNGGMRQLSGGVRNGMYSLRLTASLLSIEYSAIWLREAGLWKGCMTDAVH